MMNQVNKSNINFIITFLISIIFLYVSYILLNLTNIAIVQLILLIVAGHSFVNGIYKLLPNYSYKIIDNEVIFIREFSKRYFDSYSIKIEDIIEMKKTSRFSINFWNDFYNTNRENEVYVIITEFIKIKLDPNAEFLKTITDSLEDNNE